MENENVTWVYSSVNLKKRNWKEIYFNHTDKEWIESFYIGDKVRHKDSNREYFVIRESEMDHNVPLGEYDKTAVRPTEADAGGWMVATKNLELVEEEEDMTQLYQFAVDGKIKFGIKLAVNSAGEWVMEEKGSNDVIAVSKDLVEEVIPYTVDIQFQTGIKTYSYTSQEGKYKKDDILLMSSVGGGFNLAVVTGIDTKSKAANKELEPIGKLLTESSD